MNRALALSLLDTLRALPTEQARQLLAGLPRPAVEALREEWWWQAHGGQWEPAACEDGLPWRVWAIVAGRGFGKTRAGAEWVWQRARDNPDARIALVAASLDEVAKVMVEGDSGLLHLARSGEEPRWLSSRGTFLFPSGAAAFAYTAERPGKLRGPQHHFAWCDELAKWPRADATWDNLMLGLRLGEAPRTLVTTTPQPVPILKRILALPRTAPTHGATHENPHLPADYREAVTQMYAGTRLGRQELEGILFEDIEGALWTREMLEKGRAPQILPEISRGGGPAAGWWRGAAEGGVSEPESAPSARPLHRTSCGPPPPEIRGRINLARTVIGVDPPASAHGDACGIIVCGLGEDGIAYVLADCTVSGLRPEGWSRRVAAAAEAWDAQRIVAEKNQGGDMVQSVLHAAAPWLPVKLVTATKAKGARAEPIALHFETGRARLAGHFPELEDELCAMTYAGYEGQGRSPDRADAMVWAMSELFEKRAEPSIRMF